tara:strand:- start:7332 stop:8279 length:948 start_codon:yes stop_codon:yes gene_type:complete
MKIIVLIESSNNKIHPVSLEALAAAQKLADDTNSEVYSLCFNKSLIENLSQYKCNKVLSIKNIDLNEYDPMIYLDGAEQTFKLLNADLIMFGHSYETRDWVPRLSARLDIPFISDCVNCELIDSTVTLNRPIYQAKLIQKISLTNNKGLISLQAGSFSAEDLIQGESNTEELDLELKSTDNIKQGERFQESAGDVDLTTSDFIVSIGRGLGKEENIPLAQNFADKINAQIGASRPVVDAGWLDHSRQIGSSGQVVSPKLYFSLGISGAIQHLVGMKGSKQIIAINKDPNAPIFEIADYAVIGDVLEILPKLTENL